MRGAIVSNIIEETICESVSSLSSSCAELRIRDGCVVTCMVFCELKLILSWKAARMTRDTFSKIYDKRLLRTCMKILQSLFALVLKRIVRKAPV